MPWRDRLFQASFRGAPFKVKDVDTQVGRRSVLHQYPGKDIPYLEDLGLNADTFQVTGYVIQNRGNAFDYFGERDTLITALRAAGVGTLVHPFLGELQVGLAEKASIKESFDQGGICIFEMLFVLAGEAEYPTQIGDTISYVDSAIDDLTENALDSFLEKYSVETVSDFISNSILGDITSFISTVYNYTSAIINKTSSIGAEVLDTIGTALDQAESIIDTPATLADMIESMGEVFTDMLGVTGDSVNEDDQTTSYKLQVFDAIISSSSFDSTYDSIDASTLNRALQFKARAAFVNYAKTILLTTAAKVAVRITYDSYDDAIKTRDLLVTEIDTQLTKLGDEVSADAFIDFDEVEFDNNVDFDAIETLRSSFVLAMKEIGADLATIVYYSVPYTITNTLSLAYDRYKDLDRADQIFGRNKLIANHPGFLPEGSTIELLSK
jgi:prophage DNA circulation protein